ncbi:hypothetical protein JC525_09030 [Alteromonas sp. IB21]|uniref:hypothetical protein n=1 Tax=Alteromonas sp. IB21 TaxID=2779369 RepID=UPI0018E7EB7B|nr:hypothetical protein [Alteromonas sp. IB21]MBJ2129079.1 hypothetical protein [Alteromonas sp. IB21]
MSALVIFISQFSVVFLLGIQSQMVRDANCIGAAVGSVLIGFSQFFVFSIIGGLAAGDMFTPEGIAFMTSGPLAIVASIKTHPYMVKHVFKGRK